MSENPRILIVDDEDINIRVMKGALKDDYQLDFVYGGRAAIQRLHESSPELILLDVMMPDLNGFEVCKIIKSDEELQHIPIIFLTAVDTIEGEKTGLEAGAIDFITKPVNIDLVRLRVKNHIALVQTRKEICHQRDMLASQKAELEETIARNKHLEGIIPICMYCKKIRDDGNAWHQLESYITKYSDAMFSHGICPACYEKKYGEIIETAIKNI